MPANAPYTQTEVATTAFEISEYREVTSNTLRAFFTVTLPNGLFIRDCSLHERGDDRWIGVPIRKSPAKHSSFRDNELVGFKDGNLGKEFRRRTLEAVEQFCAGSRDNNETETATDDA